MKILAIDDKTIVREKCKRILISEGFEALVVPTVEEALNLRAKAEVALGIIDIKKPEHEGFDPSSCTSFGSGGGRSR
jgi:DNA-binding response OmpR family regulator